MSLRNTQKPLRSLLSTKETASVIVAVPAGTQPSSVLTATYDAGLSSPIASNKAGSIGVLSPIDGTSTQPVEVDASTVEYITKDMLLKIGECANCSSDLYADNATADAMQEHAHFGACVMCGADVVFNNTGELAQIATSVERGKQGGEVANYFDFTELNTVDPNTVEENDMSNQQARRALRASIASAMRDIKPAETAADDDTAVLPSDDEDDFAESDDSDGDLEVMDMDESDPADDATDSDDEDSDGEDNEVDDTAVDSDDGDSDEEASAAKPEDTNEEASDVSEKPTAEAPVAEAPASTETQVDGGTKVVTANEETPAAEAPVAEAPAATPEAETADADSTNQGLAEVDPTAPGAAEVAPTAETVTASDETVIEYVATTPAQLSPDAELIPVGETAYYVIQGEAPVAVLRKENATAGAQSLWHKPVEMRNAFRASMAGDREVALANFGGKILTHSTNVGGVIAERISQREQAAATEIASRQESFGARMRQCLETAALGINKGMFGAQFANPVASELAAVLEVNGVREPKAIITASMIQSMPKFIELVFAKALELADQSDDALTATATMVGNSDFIAPVAAVEAPAAETPAAVTAPVTETASAKPKYDMKKLFAGVGRQAHVG